MSAVDTNPVIAARPRWADDSSFSPDTDSQTTVFHRWTAPSAGQGVIAGNGKPADLTASLVATDDFIIESEGVRLRLTDPVVLLPELNATFSDTDEARKFAQAIIECCDRLDGVDIPSV
jgi:hypothetical protein